MKYIIIHWTFGNPQENRFPWLKESLEKQWHDVYVPQFPTPENQTPEAWCEVLQRDVPFVFDDETVLIGHSLWALYILDILDRERSISIAQAIFVSWFNTELWNETFDSLNSPFIKEYNRERIKNNVHEVVIFHWDNDPYVPISEAENLHFHLWWSLHLIKNGWHLNETAWFTTFTQLLEACYT